MICTFTKFAGVVLAVASFGPLARAAQPESRVITAHDAAAIQSQIQDAYNAGVHGVTIPPGLYHISPAGPGYLFTFRGLKDFSINAPGVTFLRTDSTRGAFTFIDCHNVSLTGLTLQNEIFPFTQGTLVAIDPAGLYFDFQIDAGYPDIQSLNGSPFDPKTRLWKAGTYDFYFSAIEKRSAGLFRMHLPRRYKPRTETPAAVGDLFGFRGKLATDILLDHCSHMKITGVTFLAASGFVIHEGDGGGDNYYSYTVGFGPKPQGATAPPLIAANADAFHSSNMRHGPTLENCRFEGMCDDGIAIHGSYPTVVAHAGNSLYVTQNAFQPGDAVRFFTPTGALAAEANVVADALDPKYHSTFNAHDRHFVFNAQTKFYKLTLDKPVHAKPGFRVGSPDGDGSHFVIRHCTIRNHRARGMLIKADDGLIEDNDVSGSTIADLIIAPEFSANESCYARNVVVRNNTFGPAGYAQVTVQEERTGAVTLAGEGTVKGIAQGHQHITFEGNTFSHVDGVNLLINGAQDVLIKNNRFDHPQQQATFRGSTNPNAGALISITNADRVTLQGNHVLAPGPFTKTLVFTGTDTTAVTGLDNGVTTAPPASMPAGR